VPIVTHVHGAHANEESDGFPEAWFLPDARNIPSGYATTGSYYDVYKSISTQGKLWAKGSSVFEYTNDQAATTLWYHDHALGMTRLNVYAGTAGFYILRGGDRDVVLTTAGTQAVLPNPAPGSDLSPNQRFYEIPIAIQDRTFNSDGSLFYPSSRTYFDGFAGPYIPTSDIAPIWNPEFFGNTMVVNGKTWPYLEVERRRYRFRILNGCQSRTLILQMSDPAVSFWQIGNEGGFLPAPVNRTQMLMTLAERNDVIVDFSTLDVGTTVTLQNLGPDSVFQGGTPGIDFPPARPATTGQVMQFRVVARVGDDLSATPTTLVLPCAMPLGVEDNVRQVSLNEISSAIIPGVGPKAPLLGNLMLSVVPSTTTMGMMLMPMGMPMMWSDPVTENPTLNSTEVWEIYNFTMDAHPIHLHLVQFEVVNREIFDPMFGTPGTVTPPEAWELSPKDMVISYPGQITRIKAKFDRAGLYVWHCHIVEHEDNEMMRPYVVRQTILIDKNIPYGI
jgi:bilirubin oxidase